MSGGESVDRLRQAAAQMRAVAEAATPGLRSVEEDDETWSLYAGRGPNAHGYKLAKCPKDSSGVFAEYWPHPGDSAFIAAMHPAVALAVADWLEGTADTPAFTAFAEGRSGSHVGKNIRAALAVADAFLGSL